MPSSASRSRATSRHSPRPAPRRVDVPPAERPLVVPFAAFFGVLVAAEAGYLAWLLWTPLIGWDWFIAAPLALAALALVGAVLVLIGRAHGWLVLAVAAVLLLAGLGAMAVVLAALAGAEAVWSTMFLVVGPLICLVLAVRRPVRDWTRARRSPGGRRVAGSSR
jgi:hypothetical protein